jgi:DNA-binding LacI/PurR family transcriptional regulator
MATIGALATARKAGLEVPRDLSIIAFHDAAIARYLDPPVTTIQMPLYELGRLAVEQMLYAITGGELPPETVVPLSAHIIERASTAPPIPKNP